ncbi:MAG: GGDEF domain-containing protein [Lachnospiraceae bacterium]|nr:GGDEF domain-containing protein [Lachnospiraceae bacterium]
MRQYVQMLTSTWNLKCLTSIVRGISRRLSEENIGLHIFNAYDEIYEKGYYAMDRSIFSIPCNSDYIGMIAVFNSVDAAHTISDIVNEFNKTGKPVISIDQHANGASFFGVDNYRSMYEMVEHMITRHECRTINYVGGPATNEENQLRYKAYIDCLKDHKIEIDYERIRHYRFLVQDGQQAYRDFKKKDLHLPDAVICANDNMAYGYCIEAAKDDYQAPWDFKITGFDNVERGQTFLPSLTSINRNWEQLGEDAAEGMIHMLKSGERNLEDHFTYGYIQVNESCGCNAGLRNLRNDYIEMLDRLDDERLNTQRHYDTRKLLCASPDLRSFRQAIHNSSIRMGIPGFAVCISEHFFNEDDNNTHSAFSENMKAYMAGSREDIDTSKTLLPSEYANDDNNDFIFSALHFANETFGYCVMPFDYKLVETQGHRTLMDNIALALNNIRQHMSLDMMNDRLRNLYVQDTLTGLYNRFGYRNLSKPFFEENHGKVFVVYADLDNLKPINDKYGHNYGDKAIKALADALKDTFRDEDIKIRMGGDEFIVIGSHLPDAQIEEYKDKIIRYLDHYTRKNDFPVPVMASIAHVCNEGYDSNADIETLVHLADQKMYEIKEQHHKESKGS